MKYAKKLREIALFDAPPGAPRRSMAVMIDAEGVPERLSMGFFVLPAGHASESDYHDVDEAYFITRGKGYGHLWLNGMDKEPARYEIEPGTSVRVPATVKHQMFNTGTEDIWLVWFFPSQPKAIGMLHEKPFSPETWIRRESTPENEWHPRD
jgi:mannose-6-phosphate isomerase-like protein (cupin superfamily)